MSSGGLVRSDARAAIQFHEFADRIDFEAELARFPDESKAFDVGLAVPPLLSLGSGRCHQETNLLVVPDGRDLDLRSNRQLTDRDCGRGKNLQSLQTIADGATRLGLAQEASGVHPLKTVMQLDETGSGNGDVAAGGSIPPTE